MQVSERFRDVLVLILSLACYGAAWWVFHDETVGTLVTKHLGQIGWTIVVLGGLSFPALLGPAILSAVVLVLQAVGILYLALASGPIVSGLCLVGLPSVVLPCLRFSPIQGLILALLPVVEVSAAFVPHSIWEFDFRGPRPAEWLALIVVFVSFLSLGAWLRFTERALRRQIQEKSRLDFGFQNIAHANLELQTYALFARHEAIDQERRRVAGEIHDIVGYTLTNLTILIQTALALSWSDEKVRSILETAATQATDGLSDARRALALLRSKASTRPRGANLYQQLARRFSEATHVNVRIHFGNLPESLPVPLEQALFRVMQEGLTNSFRHGKADSVDVGFWNEDGIVTLNLMDNGIGIDSPPSSQDGGIGLTGLAEMIRQLGGTFSAGPVVDGFSLKAVLPTKEAAG